MDNGFKIPGDVSTPKVETIEDVDNFVEKTEAPSPKALEVESLADDNNIHASNSSLLIYVILFFLFVGLVSSYLFLSDKIKDNISKLESMLAVSESTASKGDTMGTEVASTFKISELGIQILTHTGFGDLTYATGQSNTFSANTINAAFISSKTITSLDKNCQASSSSVGGSPLGIIAQIKGEYPNQSNQNNGVLLVQEKDSYIAFMPSTTKCSENVKVNQAVNNYRINLQLNPETVSVIQ